MGNRWNDMNTATQNNYIDYLKNVKISQHHLESAKKEAEQMGLQKGKIEGKIEVVLALHENKIPLTQISKYTKLSLAEVKEILLNHGKSVE